MTLPPALTAWELWEGLLAARWSARDLALGSLQRMMEEQQNLGAVLAVEEAASLSWARRIDEALARGADPGPLAGIPVAVKDNIHVKGFPTTCASRILGRFRPAWEGCALASLRAAGAVAAAKTNLDEFAMGSSTEHSAFGPARNPWDRSRVPGGSSGGSAAVVADGQVPLALGSDTGGSVRQPAAFCGLVGLKPQYGRVSRHGLVAFASSLDGIGAFSLDARDAALLLDAIQGPDPQDSTSAAQVSPVRLEGTESAGARPLDGVCLGIPRDWLGEGVEPAVARTLDETAGRFRSLGAQIRDVALFSPDDAVAAYQILASAEAASNLSRFDGVRFGARGGAGEYRAMVEETRGFGFGDEVKRRILVGTFVLSAGYYEAYYALALRVRQRFRDELSRALEKLDALLLPTTPTAAFALGDRLEDPLRMYRSDLFTTAANLAGNPAVSFPAGLDQDGLPVGMQLLGRPWDEAGLLRLVAAHELSHDGSGSALARLRRRESGMEDIR